jgi:hypothetical protein
MTRRASWLATAGTASIAVALLSGGGFGATIREQADSSWQALFNGRDLSGWVNINCAPDTFTVREGMIHSTGAPICELRTERMYENFVVELEYKHLEAGGNAGLFVWADALPAKGQPFLRAIEVQILDGHETENYTSHGDVFAIHGATMTPNRPHPEGWARSLPSERRARPAGEWNHYRVTARDGRVTLAVNGKEVSGGHQISPRRGYIALESEGAPVVFRNLRLQELASTGPVPAEHTADTAHGFESLYSGTSFEGWKVPPEGLTGWAVDDWRIAMSPDARQTLWTSREFGDVEFMVDWRCRRGNSEDAPASGRVAGGILLRGHDEPLVSLACDDDSWQRRVVTVRGTSISSRTTADPAGSDARDSRAIDGLPTRGALGLAPGTGPAEFANLFVRVLD